MTDKTKMDILNLPVEILQNIFSYVPQNDLVKSRSVSRKWMEYIDTLVSYRVKLNDNQNSDTVRKTLSRRISSCQIVHLKQPFLHTFHNPLLVKEIMFTNTSKENVKKILTTCTDVEKISIFTTFVGDKFFDLSANDDNTSVLNRLKKLRELEIGIQVFNTKSAGDKSSVFESLFGNPSVCFSSLRRIFMHYPMNAMEWTSFFQFLGRHSQTLKSLKLRCFDCPSGMSVVPPSVIEGLKKVNLSTLELICNCNCGDHSGLHDAFSELVEAQHSLETLTLDFHKCPLPVFKAVIRNCQKTLQYVNLCKVEFEDLDDIQGAMFSECLYLHKLKLHFLPRIIVYVTIGDENMKLGQLEPKGAETIGWIFPKNLQYLSVKGCHIPTDELIQMSTNQGCNGLQQLKLYNVGTKTSYGYGITFDTFVMICENLKDLKVFNFRCATFSSHDPDIEKLEIKKWATLLIASKRTSVLHGADPVEEDEDDMDLNPEGDTPDLNAYYSFQFHVQDSKDKFLTLLSYMISQLDVPEPMAKRPKLGV